MWPRDDGSVLILMPAGVLVLIVLGAIAVDAAIVFMAQRELQAATAAAANDAAVAAISESEFYGCGALRTAADQAETVAAAAFAARTSDVVKVVGPPTVVLTAAGSADPMTVTVTAQGRVDLLFTPAVAGLHERLVTATSTAAAVIGEGVAASSGC